LPRVNPLYLEKMEKYLITSCSRNYTRPNYEEAIEAAKEATSK